MQDSEPFEQWAYVYAQAARNNLSVIMLVAIHVNTEEKINHDKALHMCMSLSVTFSKS